MKCAIVDKRISDSCRRSLMVKGFHLIELPSAPRLGTAVESHPDMILFFHNNKIITSAEYCEAYPYIFSDIREFAADSELTFTSDEFGANYPYDAIFNALVIENMIFCKTDTVSKAIIEYAEKMHFKIIHVNQGYPACTTLAFGKSTITSDKGMAEALSKEGIDVTLISDGGISLPPYKYGFIGGASGVFGDTVFFLGNLDLHPDAELIKSKITSAGFRHVSLAEHQLTDLGRIIFI